MLKFNLDTPLIEFPDGGRPTYFTVRDAVEGIQIFGGIGSGKTSGSGRMLALKYLMNGFGGLVLTAKADEKEMWQEYCNLTNRTKDLIIIEPGGQHSFNFLEYESSCTDSGSSITENLVEVLKTVIRASEEKGGDRSSDPFWETALDMLIFNVIDLCTLAFGKVSIQDMYDIVLAAPKKDESQRVEQTEQKQKKNAFSSAFEIAERKVAGKVQEWDQTPAGHKASLLEDDVVFENEVLAAIPDARLLKSIDQFFVENYRNLSEKTRSIVEFSFSGFLFRLLREPFYSLFCNRSSTVTPDHCLDGKIILVNLPVKQFHKVGRDSQIMFKYIWQRAMERRKISLNERPVFLWADEAQNFIHEHDAEAQATARSSRIATVYISQNLPNYHANMGGAKSEYKVKSLLGTLGTKIFHANADIETNNYASEMIGNAYSEDPSRSVTTSGNFSVSNSMTYKLERMVRPEQLVGIRTGGPFAWYKVDGYVHRQGKQFKDGLSFKKITFDQNYIP